MRTVGQEVRSTLSDGAGRLHCTVSKYWTKLVTRRSLEPLSTEVDN
jgi:hypothetical protein